MKNIFLCKNQQLLKLWIEKKNSYMLEERKFHHISFIFLKQFLDIKVCKDTMSNIKRSLRESTVV